MSLSWVGRNLAHDEIPGQSLASAFRAGAAGGGLCGPEWGRAGSRRPQRLLLAAVRATAPAQLRPAARGPPGWPSGAPSTGLRSTLEVRRPRKPGETAACGALSRAPRELACPEGPDEFTPSGRGRAREPEADQDCAA